MVAVVNDSCEPATLTIAGEGPIVVSSQSELRDALTGLLRVRSGEAVMLARGPKHYMEAIRCDHLWSVNTRSGSYFTLTSFTAALTTEYSDREVKKSRAVGSIWKRIGRSIWFSRPERALSVTQVQTLFTEFLLGRKFSIPQSGA